jgi:hypothetical protein
MDKNYEMVDRRRAYRGDEIKTVACPQCRKEREVAAKSWIYPGRVCKTCSSLNREEALRNHSPNRDCRDCGEIKPLTEFYRKNATQCKPCANIATRQWQKSNKDAVKDIKRRTKLKAKYGLSLAEYKEMLEAQGGGCAICGSNDDGRNLSVDHCHVTGAIRGVLCSSCNMAIGLLKDSAELLIRAAGYLSKSDQPD